MIMNKKTYHSLRTLFAAGALLLTAACSNDETDDFYAAHPDAVRFGVTIGATPATRVNTDGDGTTFSAGDRIGISADGGTSYTTYELPSEGSEWTPADGARYLKWKEQTLSFKAYYPVTEGTGYSYFKVPINQNGLELLRKADYMLAEATDQTAGAAVPLTFKHQLAKVTVILTPAGDEAAGEIVSRVDVCVTGSIIENGIVTDKNTSADISSYKKDANTFIAIVPPQEAAPDKKFIKVFTGNSPYYKEYTLTGIPKLDEGKSYTLNLQVGHDGLKLGGITVEEWNTQDMNEGEAEYQAPTVWDGKYPTTVDEAKAWMGPETSGADDATNGQNHVFTITAARQLAALHYLMLNNAEMGETDLRYAGATYKLTTDIDLNEKDWTTIGANGESSVGFYGIFDGQGHTVQGMKAIGNNIHNGFFAKAFTLGSRIKHLNVKGQVIPNLTQNFTEVNCGGIIGEVFVTASIAFCSFEGTISATHPNNGTIYAGGIAGKLGNSSSAAQIISCYSVVTEMNLSGTVTKGGIAGYSHKNGTIKGCYWQELTGLGNDIPYGAVETNGTVTVENNDHFANAAGLNAVLDKMNGYVGTDYDYEWKAGTNGGYPVLVPKK